MWSGTWIRCCRCPVRRPWERSWSAKRCRWCTTSRWCWYLLPRRSSLPPQQPHLQRQRRSLATCRGLRLGNLRPVAETVVTRTTTPRVDSSRNVPAFLFDILPRGHIPANRATSLDYHILHIVAYSCNCNWDTCIAPPTGRPRAHHRVNSYPGARRQNETEMFSDHDESSASIAAVSAPSAACSMLAVQQQKRLCRQPCPTWKKNAVYLQWLLSSEYAPVTIFQQAAHMLWSSAGKAAIQARWPINPVNQDRLT